MNKMKKIYKLLLAVLILSSYEAKAQYDGVTLTFLNNIPYINYYNPGARVPYFGNVGIAVSNLNFNVTNSSLLYNNIYRFDNGKPVAIAASDFVGTLKENGNFIKTGFSMDLINAGFRKRKFYFSLDYRLRYYGDIDYSKDFLGFFILGNGNYMGADNPANIHFGVDMGVYTELGLGAQYDVKDNLTVGARLKVLNGIVNVDMKDMNLTVYTDPDTYVMTASSVFDIRMSSMTNPQVYIVNDLGNMFEDLRFIGNWGFGVDLGATYELNKYFGFGASVYDLGFIKWNDSKVHRHQKYNFILNNAIVDDIDDLLDMEFDYTEVVNEIVDNVIGNDTLIDGGSYNTSLRTRVMLQAYGELNPMARLTALAQFCFVNGEMTPAFTIAYSGVFFKNILSITANYTYSKYCGNCVGLGAGVHLGPFNIYAVTDNFLLVTQIGAPVGKLMTSYSANNLRFGIVWTIGSCQN